MNAPTERRERKRATAFAGLAIGLAAIYATLALWDGYADRPEAALALILLAFVLYLLALGACRRLAGRAALLVALLGGLAFRLILLPEPPLLSDDYYRYLWDGRVQLEGINPFRHAPAEAAVAGIDDALRARVNHPTVPTIYPPLAQTAFLIAAALPSGWLGLKLIWLVCDVALAALLWRIVPRDWRLGAWTIYWWSPLVVVEVAWNAHLDLLGALPLVIGIQLAGRGEKRGLPIGVALAGAALVKYFAVVLVPAAARRHGWKALAGFAAICVALYAPYLGAGFRLFEGLVTYGAAWRFNAGAFHILAWMSGATIAKLVAAGIVAWIAVLAARDSWPLERAAFWLTGAILICSPTLHPWYVLWMVPLIAMRPNVAWLYLTGAVFLAYYGLGTYRALGTWPEPWWVKLTIHGPFLVLLTVGAWKGSWWQTALQVLRGQAVREE